MCDECSSSYSGSDLSAMCGVAIHAAKVVARSEQLRHTAAPLSKISGFYRAELSIMNAFTGALSGVSGVCAILQVSKVRTLRNL
ncbi:BnaC03g30620D [Brassica napus]|uniref:(rape) hypothetical protein n=1 Tax=Brassica napus TaxID=3708 RepID=A0A078FTZ4_BRANA|nr:unnamed protein product [Brassica napus]CDY17990.1 BnaC03g30620D [Brassica napus]